MCKNKFLRLMLCSSILFRFADSAAAQEEILIVAEEWPPFTSTKLYKQGPLVDIIEHVFKDSAYTVKIAFYPWARALSMVQKGEADCIIGAFKTIERMQYLEYPEPLMSQETALFQLSKNDFAFSGLQDLSDRKIARVHWASNSDAFDRLNGPNMFNLVDLTQCIRMLLAERVDYIAGPAMNVEYLIKTRFPDSVNLITKTDPPLAQQNMYCAISKKSKAAAGIAREINAKIAAFKQNGVYDKILHEHIELQMLD